MSLLPPSTPTEVMRDIITKNRKSQQDKNHNERIRLNGLILDLNQRLLNATKARAMLQKQPRNTQQLWIQTQVRLYHKLCQSRYVSICAHSPDVVVAVTKPVIIVHHQEKYLLGQYKITLRANPNENDPYIDLKAYPRSRRYNIHPSANSEGEVCWGMREKEIHDLVEQRSYVEALLLLDEWLHTYGQTPMCEIYNWKKQ